MKQIITIFRAEGIHAAQLLGLCRRTRKAALASLRESWRADVRRAASVLAYVEYLDDWLMGCDFQEILGAEAKRRTTSDGELYFLKVTPRVFAHLRRQARRRHQFPDQATLASLVAGLATGSGKRNPLVALAVFRMVVGFAIENDEREGNAGKIPNGAARKLSAR